MYSEVDRGWIVDPWSLAQETLNVVVATPVNLWLIRAIVRGAPAGIRSSSASASAWCIPSSSITRRDTSPVTRDAREDPVVVRDVLRVGAAVAPLSRLPGVRLGGGDPPAVPRRAMILVTGATGHLGANLVRRLLEDGEPVRVLLREGTATRAVDGLAVERVLGDIRDYGRRWRPCGAAAASTTARRRSPTPRASSARSTRPTWSGPATCCAPRWTPGVTRVVVTGSFSAVGHDPTRPVDETVPVDPFGKLLPYQRSKIAVEHECLKAVVGGSRRGGRDLVRHPRAERLPSVPHGAAAARLRQRAAARLHPGRLRVRRGARHRRGPSPRDGEGAHGPEVHLQHRVQDRRRADGHLRGGDRAAPPAPAPAPPR